MDAENQTPSYSWRSFVSECQFLDAWTWKVSNHKCDGDSIVKFWIHAVFCTHHRERRALGCKNIYNHECWRHFEPPNPRDVIMCDWLTGMPDGLPSGPIRKGVMLTMLPLFHWKISRWSTSLSSPSPGLARSRGVPVPVPVPVPVLVLLRGYLIAQSQTQIS